jgi:hypothetical protein
MLIGQEPQPAAAGVSCKAALAINRPGRGASVPRLNPSGRLLGHTLDDEGVPFRYLLAHRKKILERR